MVALPLKIFDETLRDGEQQAGLVYPDAVKRELAQLIADTGVHQIDLMPAVDEAEAALAASLLRGRLDDVLTAATPAEKTYVDQAKACGFRRVILFYAVSDRLIVLRDDEVQSDPFWSKRRIDDAVPPAMLQRARDAALTRIRSLVEYAAASGLRVDFAAEDASRADNDFLVQWIRELGPRLDHFLLCDTVGVLTPQVCGPWVADLLTTGKHPRLGVHFHNDMGLALENTLQAVLAGATMVSGTFAGVGERAGNVAVEQVLRGLQQRYAITVDGIDLDAVDCVVAYLDAHGYRPAAPYTDAARRHMSGQHVRSLLQDPKSYSIFDGAEPEIWFGKVSGAGNFQYLFEKILGQPLAKEQYQRLSRELKLRARREQRCYSTEEMLALLAREGLGRPDSAAADLPQGD